MLPFLTMPVNELRPPAPNKPVPPTSNVAPVLSSVPLTDTVPPARPKWLAPASAAVAKVPPRFRLPLLTLIWPGLLQVVALRLSAPPFTLSVPLLLKTAGVML